jgi:hypothetical protein
VRIHVGFDLTYESAHATPMIFMLNVHPSRMPDLVTPDRLRLTPSRAITPYIDGFGNKCVRVLAPPGELRIACDTIVADSGRPDRVDLAAEQHAVADLPHDALVYLLGSRYCETDLLMDKAWELFGATPPGWRRVQAICDFVHAHIRFNYQHADATRGASRGYAEQRGVCRDFAHLAVTFCHSGALLHRLSRRHRRAAGSGADGFQRLVRGLRRRPLAHLRRAPQHAAHRPRSDRARPRRRRRGDQHHLRADLAQIVCGDHARGGGGRLCVGRGPAARLQRVTSRRIDRIP